MWFPSHWKLVLQMIVYPSVLCCCCCQSNPDGLDGAEQSKNNNPEGSQIAATLLWRRNRDDWSLSAPDGRSDTEMIQFGRRAVYFNFIALNCSQITDNLINYKHAGAKKHKLPHDLPWPCFCLSKVIWKHNSRSISTVKLNLYHWW